MRKASSSPVAVNLALPMDDAAPSAPTIATAPVTISTGPTIASRPLSAGSEKNTVADTFFVLKPGGQRAYHRIVIQVRRSLWINGAWRLAGMPEYEQIGDPPRIRGYAAREWAHMGPLDGVMLVPYTLADPEQYPMAPKKWWALYEEQEQEKRDDQGRRVRIERCVHLVTLWHH